MRQNIVNICNEIATGAGLDFEILNAYKIILDYCIKTGTLYRPRLNTYEIKSGCLFINNKLIERVAPLPARTTNDAATDYYENLILNRQENGF